MAPPQEGPVAGDPVDMTLDVMGLGIIVHAPSSTAHIADGDDYFTAHFMTPEDVRRHARSGTITAFATGSPGRFHLEIRHGAPTADALAAAEFTLRLAVRSDGRIVFRDLYDLMEWSSDVPQQQVIALAPGIHRLTILSSTPSSGVLGDDQRVTVHMEPLDEMPPAPVGIPTLGPAR